MADERQIRQVTVGKRAQQRDALGEQNVLASSNHFKIGEEQKVDDVLKRGPVEQRLRVFQPQPLRCGEDWLPGAAEPMQYDARSGVAHSVDAFKDDANVEEK